MQNIVVFIEPNEDAFITSEKIANIYLNRFMIDEDAGNELFGIKTMGKSACKFEKWPYTSLLGFNNPLQQEFDWMEENERKNLYVKG